MPSPLLLVSFGTELGNRVRRILRKSGHEIVMCEGQIPNPTPPVCAVIVVSDAGSELDLIRHDTRLETAPRFLIGSSEPPPEDGWLYIQSDAVDADLAAQIAQHTTRRFDDAQAIWASAAMHQIRHTVERIGPTSLPVLITGESGTGKEVIAQTLHRQSTRSHRPLVVVDCAAIAPTLMESELFGHQKGAFTGASSTTRGLVRKAHGGTFFLDEIGELPTAVQVKLLRLLQDGSYRSVGGTDTRVADLRIIAATNRDIEVEVSKGRFRRDLYHRLNGARIHIPPLRERTDDIEPLFESYLDRFVQRTGRTSMTVSPSAMTHIRQSPWPGNIRELVNCAHYVASLADGDRIEVADLPPSIRRQEEPSVPEPLPVADAPTPISSIRTDLGYKDAKREWLDIFEEHYIQSLLHQHGGNVSAAAQAAGMDRRSIQRIVKRIKQASGAPPTDESP